MATVDVAVPCYQYGHYLHSCVASVLSQDLRDLRVAIIDNASTDNSLQVARGLAAEDPRVEVIAHSTNLGQHASFNEAIDWAKSKYFVLLCADDLLAPGSLSRAVAIMEKHSEVHLTYGQGLPLGPDYPSPILNPIAREAPYRVMPGRELLERFCRQARSLFSSQSVLVRTAAQKEIGYYRPELPHTDDYEMWMRFAITGAVAEIQAVQGFRRVHPLNRCAAVENVHSWDLHYEAALEGFFAREGALFPGSNRLRRIARRTLGERAYWGSMASLLRGDVRLGLSLLKFALTRSPMTLLVPPVGYLFRQEDAPKKILQVAADAMRTVRAGFGEGRMGF
jgi:glycosyltransferase involved in cell wall biosynthesis